MLQRNQLYFSARRQRNIIWKGYECDFFFLWQEHMFVMDVLLFTIVKIQGKRKLED